MKKADLILTSDWHLRESVPECRTDDFWQTQWEKVMIVSKLQREHECPVLHAGDLFHHWKPSPYLLSHALDYLPDNFWTIYGQHDLPQHNLELRQKSGIHALHRANRIQQLPGVHWGQTPTRTSYDIPYSRQQYRAVVVWHKMVWKGKRLWPGQTDPSAVAILKKYKDYDLILTGDNHKSFVEEYDGRLLVNPGSLMRQSANQIDHRPRVYLYDAQTNTVVPEYIPVKEGAVSRMHIEKRVEREDRIEAFISKFSDEWDIGLSFEENLKRFFKSNKVLKSVEEIVWKAILKF